MKVKEWNMWNLKHSQLALMEEVIGKKKNEKYLRQELSENPDDLFLWAQLMFYHNVSREFNRALEVFDEAPEKDDLLYHIKAMALNRSGKDPGDSLCIESLKKALQLNTMNLEARLSLATFYNRKDRHNEALELWNDLLELNPLFADAWFGRSRCYYFLKNLPRALKAINSAIFCTDHGLSFSILVNKSSEEIKAHYLANRAQIYADQEKKDKALADYRAALEISPESEDLMKQALYYCLKINREKQALEICFQRADKLPDNINIFNLMLSLAGRLADLSSLEKAFDEIKRLSKEKVEDTIMMAYAQGLANCKKFKRSAELLEQILCKSQDQETRAMAYQGLLNLAQVLNDRILFEKYSCQARKEGFNPLAR